MARRPLTFTLIHNYWINSKRSTPNIGARRCRLRNSPILSSAAANGYIGANISVPHKETALKLSEADERARAIGAANALWYDRR